MKRKILAILSAAAVSVAGVLCGCSFKQNGEILINNSTNNTQAEKELTFYGYKADTINLLAIEDILSGYNNINNGINIIYEGVKGSEYWRALELRKSAAVLDDIFMIDHDRAVSFCKEGKLADLSDIVDVASFVPIARAQMTDADGEVHFMPMNISTYNLYINYDVLSAHGQSVPQSYAEFAEVCNYFVSQNITPVIANNDSALTAVMTAKSMFDVYRSENSAQLIAQYNQNPAALASLYDDGIALASQMISNGWIDAAEAHATTQADGDIELFEQNTRPFMITCCWASVGIKDSSPDLNYGMHPLPVLDDGSVLVVDVNTCVSINADSNYIDEAKDFLSYMMQPTSLWNYCESQSSFMALNGNHMPGDKALAPSNEYLTNGRSVIGSDYRLKFPIDTYLKRCSAMLLGGSGAADVRAYLHTALGSTEVDA